MQSSRQSEMQQVVENAQALQKRLTSLRVELSETELTGKAGDGRVAVTLRGTGETVRIHIDPTVADPNDVAALERFLLAAFGDAQQAIRTLVDERMRTA